MCVCVCVCVCVFMKYYVTHSRMFVYLSVYLSTYLFEERSQNYKTRLLASSCLCLSVLSVRLSVRLEQLNGLLLNLIFEDFSKVCRENLSFIKI